MVPIELEAVPHPSLPQEIGDIHLLPFTGVWDPDRGVGDAFLAQTTTLSKLLLTDRAWVKEHTRLGEMARRWDVARAKDGVARAEALLVRGDALADAELWISRRPREAPEPTELHRAYTQESRKAEQARSDREREQLSRTRRFQMRSAWALATVAVMVLVGLVVGIIQARDTERREATVLTSLAHKAIDERHYERALRIALQALPVRS